MPEKLKIIIVDDHSVTLAGILAVVEKIDFVEIVGSATSGKDALDLLNKQKVDILITDIQMSDIDGIELSKIVKRDYPDIKIIAITQHRERWVISKLINIPINAIVLKSKIDDKELRHALLSVNEGKDYYSSEIAELFFKINADESEKPYLTLSEKEILKMICEENTTNEISLKLSIATSTIEIHRNNLFTKLNVKSQSGLVREAIKYGFCEFE